MGRSIQLGRIFGIPFRVDFSWFFIFIFITLMLSMYIFPGSYGGWPTGAYWGVGIATSLLFFASVVAHELSHSLVGRRYGIPIKSITLFFFGGVAHIGREAQEPGIELKMAIAGPLCSLVLGVLFYTLYLLLGPLSEYAAGLTFWLAYINGVLAAFNMIPGFPLDGGRVLRAILWKVKGDYLRASRIATRAGYGVSFAFIIGGFLIFILLGGWDGLWLIFLGFFLNTAARSSYQQTLIREALKGYTAQNVMVADFPRIPRQLTISQIADGPLRTVSGRVLLVTDGEKVEGTLTLGQLRVVPRNKWDLTTAGQVMTPLEELKAISPATEALAILEGMESESLDVVAVVSEGRVAGMVLREDLIRFGQRLGSLKG
jgi:Zn-dependent protease/CBS domain-containing protein